MDFEPRTFSLSISWRLATVIAFLLLGCAHAGYAQVAGGVRVMVRDTQKLAVPGADVVVKAENSARSLNATTNSEGEATFPAVPLGHYVVTVTLSGFAPVSKTVAVASNVVTPLDVELGLLGVTENVEVTGVMQTINPESTRTSTIVEHDDIIRDPGADRAGSMAMITNNSPGAYMLHDHLHSRGGHGVEWEIDGVPVASSAMAAVGAQFDPQDVDTLEVNRGGLSAAVGDRPYGVFNVVPRSGFEAKRFGDLTGSYGSYQLGSVHLAMGDHTDNQKAAYFASFSANRTDFGLERVAIPVLHDEQHMYSGFTSLIYNKSMHDQFRLVGSLRSENDQVPNTPAQEAIGIDDREAGRDAFTNVTWLHTSDSGNVLTVSPYYHFNRQQYLGGAQDPLITSDDHTANYMGAFANFAITRSRGTVRFGTDAYAEHDDSTFSLTETVGDLRTATQTQKLWANVAAAFVEGSYRTTEWLTVNGGARFERFAGTVTEHAASPRVGAALAVGKVGVVRASYSKYYQHPPTSTISGPLLDFALSEGFGFLPVYGEHDSIWEVGFGIPVRGWTLDFDAYRNMVDNLQDHDVLGNSNLLLPLTIEHGRVRAFESTLRSPVIANRVQLHYAFAYQIAEGQGVVTGGMTDFRPPADSDYFYLDHDQRVTFNSGATVNLPQGFWASTTILVGSGFLLGEGPDHLPAHVTADVAVGKTLGQRVQLRFTATNLTNKTYLTGFENAFAGTHYAAPRQVSVQVQYKFHY